MVKSNLSAQLAYITSQLLLFEIEALQILNTVVCPIKGVLYSEMPQLYLFLISRYFNDLNFNMCMYTVKKQN